MRLHSLHSALTWCVLLMPAVAHGQSGEAAGGDPLPGLMATTRTTTPASSSGVGLDEHAVRVGNAALSPDSQEGEPRLITRTTRAAGNGATTSCGGNLIISGSVRYAEPGCSDGSVAVTKSQNTSCSFASKLEPAASARASSCIDLPLRRARVELWSGPYFLFATRTDAVGEFEFCLNNQADNSVDLYVVVLPCPDGSDDGDACGSLSGVATPYSVRAGPSTTQIYVTDCSFSPALGVCVGTVHWDIVDRRTNQGGAYHLYDLLANDAYDDLASAVSWQNTYQAHAVFPAAATGFTTPTTVGVADGDQQDPDVVLQAYATFVLYQLYNHEFPAFTLACTSHTWGVPSDTACAMIYGAATFLQAAMQNDPIFEDTPAPGSPPSRRIDLETPSPAVNSTADEGAVAATLWDLFDPANETHDSIGVGLGPIWQVLRTTHPGSLCTFRDKFNQTYGGATALNNILFDHHAACAVPVLLVHGWCPAAGIWNRLGAELDTCGIPYYVFDYAPGTGNPQGYAKQLRNWVASLQANLGYDGPFDIVCHSMGALVTRWYLEYLDHAPIRQWIGIAPVNHGAAAADLASAMPQWIRQRFPCYAGEAITEMDTESPTVTKLNALPRAPGVTYRIVVGTNTSRRFSSFFGGYTRAKNTDVHGRYYYWTLFGDGAVALEQSRLAGAQSDTVEGGEHTQLLDNPRVVSRVVGYLSDPMQPSKNDAPPNDPGDDHGPISSESAGAMLTGEQRIEHVVLDTSVQRAVFLTGWGGSDVDVVVQAPDGTVLTSGVPPLVEAIDGTTSVWQILESPAPGTWTATIKAVDMPAGGEVVNFLATVSSGVAARLSTRGERRAFATADTVVWQGSLTRNGVPMPNSAVSLIVIRPDGVRDSLSLHDDGANGDSLAGDWVFSARYRLTQAGGYEAHALATASVPEVVRRMDVGRLWVNYGVLGLPSPEETTRILSIEGFPSPCHDRAEIRFTLAEAAPVRIEVFDVAGRKVRSIMDGRHPAGVSNAFWDVRDDEGHRVPDGLYLCRLAAAGRQATQRIVVISH